MYLHQVIVTYYIEKWCSHLRKFKGGGTESAPGKTGSIPIPGSIALLDIGALQSACQAMKSCFTVLKSTFTIIFNCFNWFNIKNETKHQYLEIKKNLSKEYMSKAPNIPHMDSVCVISVSVLSYLSTCPPYASWEIGNNTLRIVFKDWPTMCWQAWLYHDCRRWVPRIWNVLDHDWRR